MPATKREKPSNELTESKLDLHRAKLGQIFTTPSGQCVTPAKLDVMQVDIIDAIQQVVLPNGKRRKVTDSAFRACIADLERYVEVAQKQRGREWMEACVCQVNSDNAPLRVPAMLADKARLREAQREQAKGSSLEESVITPEHHALVTKSVLVPNELQAKGKMAPRHDNRGALQDLSMIIG